MHVDICYSSELYKTIVKVCVGSVFLNYYCLLKPHDVQLIHIKQVRRTSSSLSIEATSWTAIDPSHLQIQRPTKAYNCSSSISLLPSHFHETSSTSIFSQLEENIRGGGKTFHVVFLHLTRSQLCRQGWGGLPPWPRPIYQLFRGYFN